jgi:hypothetical protein
MGEAKSHGNAPPAGLSKNVLAAAMIEIEKFYQEGAKKAE